MKILDPGHCYSLPSLDGEHAQVLQFVKRSDGGYKYPGNTNSYPGTTMQNVIRALLDRMAYVNKQKPAFENRFTVFGLRLALFMLEFRAARKHGKFYLHTFSYAEKAAMCPVCFHTDCKHGKG